MEKCRRYKCNEHRAKSGRHETKRLRNGTRQIITSYRPYSFSHHSSSFQLTGPIRQRSNMNAGIYNKISGLVRRSYLSSFTLRRCSGKPKNEESEEPPIPMNTLAHVYSATNQPKNGKVYDNKPFKMPLEAGKPYSWCLCGESKTQPLCDGTHKLQALMITLKPVKFAVAETKEYWICNCKQTKNRPFCDGTHKTIVVDTPVKPHH